MVYACADPESFVRWVQLQLFIFVFFFLMRGGGGGGGKDSNTTISGPSTARQRNAIHMAFRWRVDAGPTLNACQACKLCAFTGDPDLYC